MAVVLLNFKIFFFLTYTLNHLFQDRYRTRPDPVCTLDQELLPPSRRPSVQRMVDEGRRPHRYRREWVSKTGLDYYPFHK